MAPITRAQENKRGTSQTARKRACTSNGNTKTKQRTLQTARKHACTSKGNTKGVSAVRDRAKKQTFKPLVATRSKWSEILRSLNKAIESNNQNDALNFALQLQSHPVSICQKSLNRALLLACNSGNKFLVQSLLLCSNIYVNCRDTVGNTPLMICAMKGFCVIAQILIQKGAGINYENSKGDTALILSSTNSGSMDMVKLLIDQDTIDIFHKNLEGSTCLTKTVQALDFEVVKIIIKKAYSECSSEGKYTRHRVYRRFILPGERMARIFGLHKVFIYLEKEISERKSALLAAVSAGDLKSINFLLSYLSASELKACIHDSLLFLVLHCYEERSKAVNTKDVEIVRKIIDNLKPLKHFYYRERLILSQAVSIGNLELLALLCQYVNKYRSIFEDIYEKIYYSGVTAIFGQQDVDSLQVLLQHQPDLMYICERKAKLIDNAIRKGAAYFLGIFLDQGRQMDVAESLYIAIEHQRKNCFDLIIEKLNVKALSAIRDNMPRFFNMAVKVGNEDIITALLGLGANVNGAFMGETPLMCCRRPEIALMMLQNGADINAQVGSKQSSALLNLFSLSLYLGFSTVVLDSHSSVIKKNTDILLDLVSLYIKHGANIDSKDLCDQTAVMMASKVGQCEKILQFLLDSGANPNNCDFKGKTALHFAVSGGCLQNVQILLNFKAGVNAQCHSGESCLHLAAARQDKRILRTLVEHGGNVNVEDKIGNSPLFKAIHYVNIDTMKYLIEKGSNVNHQNKEGTTAMMMAAKNRCTEIVSLLCDNGASINLRNDVDGHNVVDIMVEGTVHLINTKEAVSSTIHLLRNGGSAANIRETLVLRLICLGELGLLKNLIYAGLSPSECPRAISPFNIREFFVGPSISPFYFALLINRTKIARYFLDIFFLTETDITDKKRIAATSAHLTSLRYKKSQNILDELATRPMSLERMCLITISSALGAGIQREEKIRSLPIPAMFKDKLMFKTKSTLPSDEKGDETREVIPSRVMIIDDDVYDSDEESVDYDLTLVNFPYESSDNSFY